MKGSVILTDIDSFLSEEELQEIDAELEHVPYKSGAAIDALKIVQSKRGWISDESLAAIAKHLEMSIDELEGIATFYNLIYRRPVGKKVILFCDSVSCWICGCEKALEKVSDVLKIGYGETTTDEKYTLLPVPCLGACDRAPVMMVGDELITDLDDAKIEATFNQASSREDC